MKEDLAQITEMIKDISYAMMTTVDARGKLHSRPMATLQQSGKFSGTLWFFTHLESLKVYDIKDSGAVNLTYAQPQEQRYISLSGRANIIQDKQKMKELWTSELLAWFPDGLRDSQIALIKVAVDSGEIWDAPINRLIPEKSRHVDLHQ